MRNALPSRGAFPRNAPQKSKNKPLWHVCFHDFVLKPLTKSSNSGSIIWVKREETRRQNEREIGAYSETADRRCFYFASWFVWRVYMHPRQALVAQLTIILIMICRCVRLARVSSPHLTFANRAVGLSDALQK
jgi:hypothetical protein